LASACSDGGARQGNEDDADDGEQLDAGGEQPDAAPGSTRKEDGAAAEDAGSSARDGATSPAMDAAPGEPADAAPTSGDARMTSADGGSAACAVDAGRDSSCVAHLCEIDGSTLLALDNEQQWTVGALDWGATVCGQVLGWPSGRISDTRLVYSLTDTQLEQIQAGAPVQTYYGSPQSMMSASRLLECAVELRGGAPACRDMR
jgi:hypothetical protein